MHALAGHVRNATLWLAVEMIENLNALSGVVYENVGVNFSFLGCAHTCTYARESCENSLLTRSITRKISWLCEK